MAARGFGFFCCCLSLGFGVFRIGEEEPRKRKEQPACLARGSVLESRIFVKCFISPLQFGGFLDAPMRPAVQVQVNLGCHTMGPSFSETCND
mgnify:CR=1 FL=1